MNEKRIQNILLTIVAGLLLLNLGVTLSPVAHAVPKAQYKAIAVMDGPGVVLHYQRVLDQQSAEGWEYVAGDGRVLIFKK